MRLGEPVLQALRLVHPAPAPGQPRRDFLAVLARRRGNVPAAVYEELVDLHDRVRNLEQQVEKFRQR